MTITELNKLNHGQGPARSFDITVELISPLCLAAAMPSGNLTRTLDYIPGSSVRGALATHYRAIGHPVDAAFEQLFLSGEVSYGNLYYDAAIPIPLSARSCKHTPGFERDGEHGVVDWLLSWCAQDKGSVTAPRHDVCPYTHTRDGAHCGAPLERFSGYHARNQARRVETAGLRAVLTRSATDERLQTAAEGLLYSIETLQPSASGSSALFQGAVVCATQAAADLVYDKLLDPFFNKQSISLFIGTARSRGLGEIKTYRCQPAKAYLSPLAERLDAFNRQLRIWEVNDSRVYFSLTLYSDLIIQDEFFHSCAELSVPLLAWEAGLGADIRTGLQLEQAFSNARTVSGWNPLLRAPKTNATVISMGSVFLYSADQTSAHELTGKLATIEAYGLGARRAEGFGRVVACDPFHLDAGKGPL